jgi:hypothetical protein
MAQHDMNIANQGFPAFRSDLNDALAALVSNSSGSSQPTTMFAHQWWVDTNANPSVLKIRNADNDAWITIGTIDQTDDKFNLTVAGTLSALGNVSFNGGSLVFNESGADRDARFEGDTDANLLFTDASTDRVGIGTNTPTEKLDVAGIGRVAGSMKVAGTSSAGGDLKLYEDTDNGTNYVGFKAPASVTADLLWTLPASDGTADQVLKTDGAGALGWASAGGGGTGGVNVEIFTANGTFTIPTGVTKLKVTVVGGGGAGGTASGIDTGAGGGGGGGVAIKWLSGVTPGNTLDVTRGTAGNTSSVASGTETISTISATGGAVGDGVANDLGGAGGAGGVGSGGDLNLNGGYGGYGVSNGLFQAGGGGGGAGGAIGGYGVLLSAVTLDPPVYGIGYGAGGMFGGRGGDGGLNDVVGTAATGYGNGGGGGAATSATDRAGGAGSAGVVIFEW